MVDRIGPVKGQARQVAEPGEGPFVLSGGDVNGVDAGPVLPDEERGVRAGTGAKVQHPLAVEIAEDLGTWSGRPEPPVQSAGLGISVRRWR